MKNYLILILSICFFLFFSACSKETDQLQTNDYSESELFRINNHSTFGEEDEEEIYPWSYTFSTGVIDIFGAQVEIVEFHFVDNPNYTGTDHANDCSYNWVIHHYDDNDNHYFTSYGSGTSAWAAQDVTAYYVVYSTVHYGDCSSLSSSEFLQEISESNSIMTTLYVSDPDISGHDEAVNAWHFTDGPNGNPIFQVGDGTGNQTAVDFVPAQCSDCHN